jgi:hypothetical protein
MTYKPGTPAPADGVYWCSVCKLPASFKKEDTLPECKNKCGRGRWELVRPAEKGGG